MRCGIITVAWLFIFNFLCFLFFSSFHHQIPVILFPSILFLRSWFPLLISFFSFFPTFVAGLSFHLSSRCFAYQKHASSIMAHSKFIYCYFKRWMLIITKKKEKTLSPISKFLIPLLKWLRKCMFGSFFIILGIMVVFFLCMLFFVFASNQISSLNIHRGVGFSFLDVLFSFFLFANLYWYCIQELVYCFIFMVQVNLWKDSDDAF